ncbi:hypothetical protein GCM10029978_021340 [Actinoallomurus acanthiterrae]
MIVASGLLSLLIGGAFAVLLRAITGLNNATALARHSEEVLRAANDLERLVIDIESGQRGFVITRDERFLQPWNDARAKFAGQAALLQRLAGPVNSDQRNWVDGIVQNGTAYVDRYSVRVVNVARKDPAAARTTAVTEEGKERIEALRAEFGSFAEYERDLVVARNDSSIAAARMAVVVAVVGISGSILLILLFGGYLTRAVVRPVRRASMMAGVLAGGDLSVRMPETGPGEIGKLEHSFNTMAGSLETSRDELRRIAEEQAALRRVATLVAHGVPPAEVFMAVTSEIGRILEAEYTVLSRLEHDRTTTVVGHWTRPGAPSIMPPLDGHWTIEEGSVGWLVSQTGRAARMANYAHTASEIGIWSRSHGIDYVVGCPITVEGRLWGIMYVLSPSGEPQPANIENRMLEFMELVATAIANTESRTELTASRARIVEAADAARRRIERDLHDGTQQRLISLGLELRLAEARMAPEDTELKERLSHAAQGLTSAVSELQEISRGLHPAILSKGGIGSAVKALARRSSVPVELDVTVDRHLPERIEVAVYYVVSEALTNAAKHAQASAVWIALGVEDGAVQLSIRDDGIGGAVPGGGSGLIGLSDRVETLGGRLEVTSTAGHGTLLLVRIPIQNE